MKLSRSKTQWVKFGKIKRLTFVGRDTICIGSGCYLTFINLQNHHELLYHANNKSVGEGVGCLAGHRTLPIIAFAEKCRFPKIIVMICPSFRRIIILDKKTSEDYLSMSFSESDFLVTLNDTPSFVIKVWNWRNGHTIASMEKKDIYGQFQIIRCNLSSPLHFAQLQTGHSKLTVWDVAVCGKKCVLSPHKITPLEDSGVYSDILWTTEGTLFVLDLLGHAYALNSDNKLTRIITWEGEGTTVTAFAWFKAGLVIAGPNGQVKHYKKVGKWVSDWTITPPKPLKKLSSNYKDSLVGISIDGEILHYQPTENQFKYIKRFQSKFNNICLIYPLGRYFVSLQHNREITSWELVSGNMKHNKKLNGNALAMTSNPEYPYVGVAYSHGVLELLSIYHPEKITTMTTFNLSKNPLNNVSFTSIGKLIVAANLDLGEFYIIEGIPGSHMQIIGTVQARAQICDYMLVASTTCMRLFTIHVTSKTYICGNKIVRYCVIRDKPGAEVKVYTLETKQQMYSKIYATNRTNRDRVFYVTPLTTKCIHEITTKRGDPVARVTHTINTGHEMKKIILYVDKNYAITYAYDGLVIIRDLRFKKKRAIIMPHYRTYGGVYKAYVDPLGQYVLSLGRDNTLVCNHIRLKMKVKKRERLKKRFNSMRFKLMFSRPTIGFAPTDELEGLTWFEMEKINLEKYERERSEMERLSILKEFKVIRAKVQKLLTRNLEGPDNEKIDIQEFNLDVALKSQKIKDSQKECIYTKAYMEALIIAQDKVTNWLKQFCWDPMRIQGQIVSGIFDNFEIHNYVLLPPEEDLLKRWRSATVYRKLEAQMAEDDIFEPWQPKTASELTLHLRKKPKISEDEKTTNILDFLEDESPMEEEQIDVETETAFKGSVTHHFLELTEGHYTQQQVSSYFQTEFETIYSLIDVYNLKEYYNTQFNEIVAQKKREMGLVIDRNRRLRHILSELNYFSINKIHITITDPVWSPMENPQSIIVVKNSEVKYAPYISPAEQARLNAIAAEEERIRQLLLADDFRERALMAMMNGVLEIRWEDELRKDVPKPKCMLEKDPEKYNEEDLRAIYAYEEDVKFLNSERERYKKMLEAEYAKLSNTVRDGIKKFNKRLANALLTKIQLDSAIRQENLKVSRMRLKNLKRILINDKEQEILKTINYNETEVRAVNKLIHTLQLSVNELRTHTEGLQAKEKLIERAFKKEFSEASPVVLEQSTKLYKRRPKVNIRNITSVTLTLEIAKCMHTRRRTMILTQDCVDYLKALDGLDTYVNIPPAIDETTYAVICKHRRVKIENEIRMRASALEVAEAENTVQTFQKLMQQKKDYGQQLLFDLDQLRNDRLYSFHDMELQLILREGIVEIPRTGKMSDFDDVVIVSRKDVETINKIIVRAGNRKVKAMKETMDFRRGILAMEWEHTRLKMQIADLHSYIQDIEAVKVTKDIQSYLKTKKRGVSPEKVSFEDEVNGLKEQYIKRINEKKAQVAALQNKISCLKQKGKKLQGENARLNEEVTKLNVDICEFQLERDVAMEKREQEIIKIRMATLLKRSKLIKQIQKNHSDILMLQTELELLRLKTYPTLSYTIIS